MEQERRENIEYEGEYQGGDGRYSNHSYSPTAETNQKRSTEPEVDRINMGANGFPITTQLGRTD